MGMPRRGSTSTLGRMWGPRGRTTLAALALVLGAAALVTYDVGPTPGGASRAFAEPVRNATIVTWVPRPPRLRMVGPG